MATKLTENVKAPNFELVDTHGNPICFTDYRGKPVVLVLLRGFM